MPNRFSFSASREKIKRQLGIDHPEPLQQSFNIAPTQNAYILTATAPQLEVCTWGLLPHWAKDQSVGEKLSTAQAEGIASTLSFRLPIRQRRCLVLADSYYWWKKQGRGQVPYRIQLQNNDVLTFAGVWDVWQDAKGVAHTTFAIITTPANPYLQDLGAARMPAILADAQSREQWLDHSTLQPALELLQPLSQYALEAYPIDPAVDDLHNNYPELHRPLV